MKAIMIMFDSLNRRMLPPYGCEWVHAPNFARLASRSATFDRAYVGSMACMPARRELHTGRYNFLHRSWGPIEPFDDSMPEILKNNDIYTHLVSDHYHYWEEGGATYHTRYSSWENVRGQEGDNWKPTLGVSSIPESLNPRVAPNWGRQDFINRQFMVDEESQPQPQTFARGLEFINDHHQREDWFLQIETFDPHEPFFVPERFKKLYPHDYNGPHFDSPGYGPTQVDQEALEHLRMENAALVSMCDHYLGKVLDKMDERGMWEDTMLIVNTDHGFLLGEHGFCGKCRMPFYNEVANIPLFIWDPREGCRGVRRQSLVQTIDLPATLLDFFHVELPIDMMGVPLRETIATDRPVRKSGLFGLHGAHVNCTDGRYVYMRAPANPENQPLFNYTLMPTHMKHTFPVAEMRTAQLRPPFNFTKDCPTLKIDTNPQEVPRHVKTDAYSFGSLLFDNEKDPEQKHPLKDENIESRMRDALLEAMQTAEAPSEQYQRLGLSQPHSDS